MQKFLRCPWSCGVVPLNKITADFVRVFQLVAIVRICWQRQVAVAGGGVAPNFKGLLGSIFEGRLNSVSEGGLESGASDRECDCCSSCIAKEGPTILFASRNRALARGVHTAAFARRTSFA